MATDLLDGALRDNAFVQISCTACQTKFEPHAPAAESLTPHDDASAVSDDKDALPTSDEEAFTAPDVSSAQTDTVGHLPDLHDIWRQHDDDTEDDVTAAPVHNFPSWMRPTPKPRAAETTTPADDMADANDKRKNKSKNEGKEKARDLDDALLADADHIAREIDDTVDDGLDFVNLIDDSLDDDGFDDTGSRHAGVGNQPAGFQTPVAQEMERVRQARDDAPNALENAEEDKSGDAAIVDALTNPAQISDAGASADASDGALEEAGSAADDPELDFDDEVILGGAPLRVFDDTLDPFTEQAESASQSDDAAPAMATGEEDAKNEPVDKTISDEAHAEKPRAPRGFFARLLDRLRHLFRRQKDEPEEADLIALPAPDADDMRVFGDDDFIDDEAFEEARRLANVENAMQADMSIATVNDRADIDRAGNASTLTEDLAEETAQELPESSEHDVPDEEAAKAASIPPDLPEDIPDVAEDGDQARDETPPMREFIDERWQPFPDTETMPEDRTGNRDLTHTGPAAAAAPAIIPHAPKRLTALGLANLVLAFVLIVLTALNSYVLLTDNPELNPWVEAQPMGAAAISLESAGFEILPDPEGNSLIVSAVFKNTGQQAGLIDDYIIYLQDGERRTLTSWTVVSGGETIKPNGQRRFNSTLFAPPNGVAHISIEYPAGD